MKRISFKIKFDEEFKDYYIQPFKDSDDYVWLNDILPDNNGRLWMITEYGTYPIEKIDYEQMKVFSRI